MDSREECWLKLAGPIEFADKSYPSDSELNQINWGNFGWKFGEKGFFSTIPIEPSDKRFINYSLHSSTDSMYLSDRASRDWFLRNVLHQQIISSSVSVTSKNQAARRLMCVFTHGPIASGKTSIIDTLVNKLPILEDAIRIDYDRVKKQLPEYEYLKSFDSFRKKASGFCQSESAKISGKIFKRAAKAKTHHIIFEGSQSKWDEWLERLKRLNPDSETTNFLVMILSTIAPLDTCIERALTRYDSNGRFVPETEIRRSYAGCANTFPIVIRHSEIFALFDQSKTGVIDDVLLDHTFFQELQNPQKVALAQKGFNKYIQCLTDAGIDKNEFYRELNQKPIELYKEKKRGY